MMENSIDNVLDKLEGYNIRDLEDLIQDPSFDPSEYYGYIYLTYCKPEDKMYLGKKIFYNTTNVKLGKKEIAALPATRGRTKLTKQVIKESNWRQYYGSQNEVKDWVKKHKPEDIKRYVLRLCKNKKEHTYYENKFLFSLGVIEPGSNFVNDNIEGRYFTKDFI